jgi:hypothetical protein
MGVDVRPFLPVDLDGDEGLVHPAGDLFVGKRFPLHHVTPVAGRVADREEDRQVLSPGFAERLVPPGIPGDGVAGVLSEIGAFFAFQAVGRFRGHGAILADTGSKVD